MLKFVIFLIFFLTISKLNVSLKLCERSPKWSLNGKTFPYDFKSNFKLLAFLKTSCSFCRKQAKNLGLLDNELKAENKSVAILIVNSYDYDCIGRSHIFRNLTHVNVFQDIPKMDVWRINNASIDDMIIFDKYNRMVKHLSMPDSFVHSGSVKQAILEIYNKDMCSDNNKRISMKSRKPV
ncbi:unnamed protein product [Brachionus calyciflorus]|uniref:Selenoprotein P N-terminal domain-containing protein n=1 Tax=Brachionus calyciflorus TaxID=104777 RepID=A0A814GZN7_9BILA|nr:unnamed protein product [Brachionus calyciflorus]